MKNKILVVIIIILIPIFLVFNKDKINKEEIKVYLKDLDITLSLDEYLIGVVGKEMPASFNDEALKSQAIASRTFALNNINNNIIIISTNEQAYATNEELKEKFNQDYDKYYNKIENAVKSTKDLVMTYNNELIKSYYFSMSNGKTEDSMVVFNEYYPYLQVVDSSFDERNNKFEVETNYPYSNFCELLNIIYCNNIIIDNIKRDESNRVLKMNINNKEYDGIYIREKLKLRSTDFNIYLLDDTIKVTTKGYGHGVGMSQYGANYLANIGYNYEEILNYYYKNIKIDNYEV